MSSRELKALVQKAKRRPLHRNAILFYNMPDYSELPDREAAELRHERWEWSLEDYNPGYLHRSCASLKIGHDAIPRQTIAWLIADFCGRYNVSYITLCDSITRANEDIHKEGLMWRRESDQRPCFNLHKLSDEGLYRVYTEIPEHYRPPERPKPEPHGPPKERKRSAREKKNIRKRERSAAKLEKVLASLPPVEENFSWVQCDACDKWRRLYDTKEEDVPECWNCADHPNDSITCETPEDEMGDGEQWDGKTRGTKLRISISGGVPMVQVLDEDGNSIVATSNSVSDNEDDNVNDSDLWGSDDDDEEF